MYFKARGGVPTKILVLCDFGSKFYVLLSAFDRISKFCPVFSKMARIWGMVGSWELIFQLLEKF